MKSTAETELVKSILEALEARRIWSWRANAGLTVLGTGESRRVIKGAPPGTPDILGVLPGGRLFGIECKSPNGKLSETQKAWHERARKNGVCVGTVRSIGEALKLVRGWETEARKAGAA